jgi:hypothetical protein
MKIIAGNSNRPLAEAIFSLFEHAFDQSLHPAFFRYGSLCRDHGKCARAGCFYHSIDILSGQ